MVQSWSTGRLVVLGVSTVFSTSPNIWYEMPTYHPKHCCIKTLLFWIDHQRGPCWPFQYSRFSIIFQVFLCRAFWNGPKSTPYLSYKPIRKRELMETCIWISIWLRHEVGITTRGTINIRANLKDFYRKLWDEAANCLSSGPTAS